MSEAESPADRRKGGRQRTLLGGVLVHGQGCLIAECAVRNLTEGGAQVRLKAPQEILAPVLLAVLTTGQAFDAHVAWRRDAELGLAFDRTADLKAPASEAERVARRIWIEHLPRTG